MKEKIGCPKIVGQNFRGSAKSIGDTQAGG